MRQVVLFLFVFCLITGCGSSGGLDGASIRVLSPEDDTMYSAGGTISYSIETPNFSLAPPFNLRELIIRDHPGDEEEHLDEEDHDAGATDPGAREGHYHIYLDDAAGSDPHVTTWTYDGMYPLPEHLPSGMHSLRFELRNNEHVKIGTQNSETVLFFEVQ